MAEDYEMFKMFMAMKERYRKEKTATTIKEEVVLPVVVGDVPINATILADKTPKEDNNFVFMEEVAQDDGMMGTSNGVEGGSPQDTNETAPDTNENPQHTKEKATEEGSEEPERITPVKAKTRKKKRRRRARAIDYIDSSPMIKKRKAAAREMLEGKGAAGRNLQALGLLPSQSTQKYNERQALTLGNLVVKEIHDMAVRDGASKNEAIPSADSISETAAMITEEFGSRFKEVDLDKVCDRMQQRKFYKYVKKADREGEEEEEDEEGKEEIANLVKLSVNPPEIYNRDFEELLKQSAVGTGKMAKDLNGVCYPIETTEGQIEEAYEALNGRGHGLLTRRQMEDLCQHWPTMFLHLRQTDIRNMNATARIPMLFDPSLYDAFSTILFGRKFRHGAYGIFNAKLKFFSAIIEDLFLNNTEACKTHIEKTVKESYPGVHLPRQMILLLLITGEDILTI